MKLGFRNIREFVWKNRIFRKILFNDLHVWAPNSANFWRYPHLSLDCANSYPKSLQRLIETIYGPMNIHIDSIQNYGDTCPDFCSTLSSLFSYYGSDKSKKHNYHKFYSDVLFQLGRESELSVLEIGIGTDNPTAISTMGSKGKVGASLKAFRDALPKACIYGADIDRRTLFSEDRITTSYLDQVNPKSFDSMIQNLGESRFDLIIDDGLHSVQANLNSLIFAMRHLNAGGYFVAEDIPARTLPAWMPVLHIMGEGGILECKEAYLLWFKRQDGYPEDTPPPHVIIFYLQRG